MHDSCYGYDDYYYDYSDCDYGDYYDDYGTTA